MMFSRLLQRARANRTTTIRNAEPRPLSVEMLEPRMLLAATTYSGALSGKIVYTSGGHGWQWSTSLNRFATDRGEFITNTEIVEDFGNQDQMSLYADYILRAGGTVVPMRPVGHQTNEVVLDNDSPGVTYSGTWQDSASSIHYDEDYGAVADAVGYRFASTSGTETATATYTPNFPQAGFYPVYTWVLDSGNRVPQLYRIQDSGGVTEIRVDHRMVGKGWVYLGTYHFEAGSSVTHGSVQISNESNVTGVVIADAIRFGNGMGDLRWNNSGIGSGNVSGYRREDENSYMWLYRSVGQGVNPVTVLGSGNVSAPSRMAEYMNANTNPFGTSVYIGFHSNGTTGNTATATARGAVGLIDNDQGTPNQASLALYTGRQINQDMQLLNGQFEHNWSTRTTHTFTSGFGEIDEGAGAEMDMTIIEVAFHDQTQDAQLMRDPKVRDQLARSTYDATVEYFDNFGGLNAPLRAPAAPVNISAVTQPNGDVVISWAAGAVNSARGGTAAGYRVYLSKNGYGFYDHIQVAGAGTTSLTIPAAQLDGDAAYFKVTAYNTGGESPHSAVRGAQRDEDGGKARVLVVDGFDRFDRTTNVRYPYAFTGDGLVDRVWPRYNNSFDYVVQAGKAIEAYEVGVGFDNVPNEAVINGTVNLADYDAVIWLSGKESTVDDTFNATEQTLVTNYLASGGKLFASGSELGWDLDAQNGGASFYNNQLRANYVSDDANSYAANGSAGSIFAGISLSFDNGNLFYNVDTPDVLAPIAGSSVAMTYGTGGGAALVHTDAVSGAQVVTFGFPFETITTAANRAAVMDRVLDYFGLDVVFTPTGDFNGNGFVDGADFLAWQRGLGTTGTATLEQGDGTGDGTVDAADFALWQAEFGQAAEVAALASAQAPLQTPYSTPSASLAANSAGAPTADANLSFKPSVATNVLARANAFHALDAGADKVHSATSPSGPASGTGANTRGPYRPPVNNSVTVALEDESWIAAADEALDDSQDSGLGF